MLSYLKGFLRLSGLAGLSLTYPPNQSLSVCLARLFSQHPYGPPLLDSVALGRWLGRGLSLGIIGLTAFACWPPRPLHVALGWEISLVIVGMHLVASLSWLHHLVLLLIPFALLAEDFRAGRLSRYMVVERNNGQGDGDVDQRKQG